MKPVKSHTKYSSDSNAEINILPLIDVLFVVLLFFMLSSLFLSRRYSLQIELPRVSNPSSSITQKKVVTITINQDMVILLNSEKIDISLLYSKLNDLNNSNLIDHLLIDADHSVNYGLIAKILSTANSLKIKSIQLSVDKES